MAGEAVEKVLNAAQKHGLQVKPEGAHYKMQCPVHNDTKPSVSVRQGDKGATVKCWVGCETEHVVEALDLRMNDLFDSEHRTTRKGDDTDGWMPCHKEGCTGYKEREYTYSDENGQWIYTVVRCSRKNDGCPRGFSYYRPDPTARYGKRWSLGPVERTLYHLPDVLRAARENRRIWIVEGEKDADRNIAEIGETSTNCKTWRRSFTKYLHGASEIIVVIDRDNAGLQFGQTVYKDISKLSCPVRIVCTPLAHHKADLSDHYDHGFTPEDFEDVPVEQVKRSPEMILRIPEEERRKPVVFPDYGEAEVERSLVASILQYSYNPGMDPQDIRTSQELRDVATALVKLLKRWVTPTVETVLSELTHMGKDAEQLRPLVVKLNNPKVKFSDISKVDKAAGLVHRRQFRREIKMMLTRTAGKCLDDQVDLERMLQELSVRVEWLSGRLAGMNESFGEETADVFGGDVIQEVREEKKNESNVRALRPAVVAQGKKVPDTIQEVTQEDVDAALMDDGAVGVLAQA
jgi:hypothetical protein